jgi:hypothetical protein
MMKWFQLRWFEIAVWEKLCEMKAGSDACRSYRHIHDVLICRNQLIAHLDGVLK